MARAPQVPFPTSPASSTRGRCAAVPACLVLEDGTQFWGTSVGASGTTVGELVFNTSPTGYQEILTDPSYTKQVVTLTYPHIGSTGCNDEDDESQQAHAAGLVIRERPRRPSNWRSQLGLTEWLERRGVVAIADVDTRKLTHVLREKGALRCAIGSASGQAGSADPKALLRAARGFEGLVGADLASVVSTPRSYEWSLGLCELERSAPRSGAVRHHVVVYDFGVKRHILQLLVELGCRVTVVPATADDRELMSHRPDGVLLSNGPGDPAACTQAIAAVRQLLTARVPLFGICLGHQILALAAGARTFKLKFGHHGANHPVRDVATGKVLITSQNHGFAVDEASLSATVRVTHRSLFDSTIQGIELVDAPAFGFQGHPEAAPGPHDVQPLFARFIANMEIAKHAQAK